VPRSHFPCPFRLFPLMRIAFCRSTSSNSFPSIVYAEESNPSLRDDEFFASLVSTLPHTCTPAHARTPTSTDDERTPNETAVCIAAVNGEERRLAARPCRSLSSHAPTAMYSLRGSSWSLGYLLLPVYLRARYETRNNSFSNPGS